MNNKHLIPDIINDLMAKMINATSHTERQNYELQVKTIRDVCNAALAKVAVTPVKTRKRA